MFIYRKSARENRLIGMILCLVGALGLGTDEMLQRSHITHAHTWQDFACGLMIGIGIGFFAVSYSAELKSTNSAEEQKRNVDEV